MDAEIQALKRAVAANEPGANEKLIAAFARAGFEGFEPRPSRVRERERERVLEVERIGPFTVDAHGGDTIAASFLSVTVSYDKGGYNNWHHVEEKRGFYLHITTEGREFHADGTLRSTRISLFGSGVKKLLKEAARFSDKALANVQATPEDVAKLKARVHEMIAETKARNAQDLTDPPRPTPIPTTVTRRSTRRSSPSPRSGRRARPATMRGSPRTLASLSRSISPSSPRRKTGDSSTCSTRRSGIPTTAKQTRSALPTPMTTTARRNEMRA